MPSSIASIGKALVQSPAVQQVAKELGQVALKEGAAKLPDLFRRVANHFDAKKTASDFARHGENVGPIVQQAKPQFEQLHDQSAALVSHATNASQTDEPATARTSKREAIVRNVHALAGNVAGGLAKVSQSAVNNPEVLSHLFNAAKSDPATAAVFKQSIGGFNALFKKAETQLAAAGLFGGNHS